MGAFIVLISKFKISNTFYPEIYIYWVKILFAIKKTIMQLKFFLICRLNRFYFLLGYTF
jgi:hypothetical protein